MCNIILSPEFESLKTAVEKLRTELSMLLLEQDELVLVECKNIETAYMLALGNLEYKAYELQCAVLRLKRKAELIQALKNRQEKIVISKIESILDKEFAEYQAKLDEQINKMNEALDRSKCEALSDEEIKELKKMYRSVVKSLHPDLHPDISKAKIYLFNNAVSAYKNGDLNRLRIIAEMVSEPVLSDNHEDGRTFLAKEKERLAGLIRVLNDEIKKTKSEFPYNVKSIIQSEEKITEKRAELEEAIAQLEKSLEFYKSKTEEMLR